MKLGLPRYLTLGLLLAAGAALALAVGYWNISPGSFAPAFLDALHLVTSAALDTEALVRSAEPVPA